MNRAVTAPMTPERLAEIRGLQVDSLSADAEYNADVWALEQARLDLLAECDRLRAHVDHWCEQRDVEAQRAIDAEMLAEGWKAEAAALRAALASGDEAGPCEHGRTACQCYGDEVQP